MTVLIPAGDLHGRPVVTLDTADDVAEIKDVAFSYADRAVLGFSLNKRGRFSGPLRDVLPWSRVAALGRDAVMIASRDAIGEPDDTMRDAGGGENIVGTTVLTDGGVALGEVTDLVLDVGTTIDIVGFRFRSSDKAERLLPIGDTIAVSGQSLMVPAEAEEFVRDDLSGFASAVDRFRRRLRGEGDKGDPR
jgi:uncharacterized protein YrrD